MSRTITRVLILVPFLAASALLMEGQRNPAFTRHEKAYYADPSLIAFVQPGLVISIVAAKIASDGTISVDYKLADPSGAPLDRSGVVTPGAVSLSFLAAYIPRSQEQYTSYIVRTATSPSGVTATQAAADSGGTTQTVSTGENWGVRLYICY